MFSTKYKTAACDSELQAWVLTPNYDVRLEVLPYDFSLFSQVPLYLAIRYKLCNLNTVVSLHFL
jgi:hypothetical protein